jgi:hypothetical protein
MDEETETRRDQIAQELMAQQPPDPWTERFGPQGWSGDPSPVPRPDTQVDPWANVPQSNYITDMRDTTYDPQVDVWGLPRTYGFDQTYTPYFDDTIGLSAEMGNNDIYNQTMRNGVDPETIRSTDPNDFQVPVPPGPQNFFEGSPYSDAGASGMGSYAAPGPYGSNRRANL